MAKHEHSMEYEHEHDDYEDSDSSPGALARTSGDGSLGARPPPKKRNRAALSCTLCRERKVKCDRVIPCQQCIKRGDADNCHLDPAKRGPQTNAKINSQSKRDSSSSHSRHSQSHSVVPPMPDIVGSGANEVDTIKARLAQLEQALAQQNQGSSPSFSIPSSSGLSHNNDSQPGLVRPSWATMNGGNSSNSSFPVFSGAPANQFAPSHRSSSGSLLQQSPSSSHVSPYYGQQGNNNQSFGTPSNGGRQSDDNTSSYTPMAASSFALPPLQSGSESNAEPNKSSTRAGSTGQRGDVDSDTEDAALVLEGLAMGARNECEKTAKRDVILQPISSKSIEAYAEDDKKKDIMSADRYGDGKRSGPHLGALTGKGALPMTGPCEADAECGKEDAAECAILAEILASDPDAEFGPDGKRIPPAKKVCILLSRHENSLFNLVYGPETFLGWGMGWAFAAAEKAGDMMKVSDVVGCKGALQREAVLRAIIRSLPDRESATQLINVYDKRVKFLTGNSVHMPTFRKEMAAFYDLGTVEKRARVVNFVDPGWLALFLMMLVHSLHFHPIERPEQIMHFFDGRTVHLWRSAAQTTLVLARYQSSTSIAVLQALILVNFYTYCTGKSDNALRHVAISNAIEMGLHRLGSKDQQSKAGESNSVTIRREIAKRIWYNLIICDWCSCGATNAVYRIHPSHFNTPLPGNYNDADLCISPLPASRPATEHTEMSFMLQQIQVSTVMREHVDMQNATQLDNGRLNCSDTGFLDGRYRGLLEQAPSFYRIGSEEGENDNVEVERWLFQQFVFDKLLRLHRPSLSSKAGARAICVVLARSILDVQRRIRSRCSIVDRLYMKLSQSFSAAIVLCLDLLQTPPSSASSSMRDIVRGEVFEALQALRHVGASHHATSNHVRVIEALLAEEQARWTQYETKSDVSMQRPSGPLRKKNLLNLALRVAKATRGEEPFKPTVNTTAIKSSEGNDDIAMMDSQMSDENQSSEQSRLLMEQLLMGKPTYDEPSSFARADFQKATLLDHNQLNLSQMFPAPEEDSQPFDLGKFLAECDTNSSPGSVGSGHAPFDAGFASGASDSGHSSLHNGRANSTASSSRLSHSSSHSRLDNSSAHHSPTNTFKPADDPSSVLGYVPTQGLSPSAAEKSTGLDGFWNWILAQGSIPANSGDIASFPAQPPLGGQGSTYMAPVSAQSSSSQYPVNPSQNSSFPRKLQQKEDSPATPNNNTTNTDTVFSLGTPSAGIGSSWMNTPGLFDFALESGNDGSLYSNLNSNNTNNNNYSNNGFGSLVAPNTASYWS